MIIKCPNCNGALEYEPIMNKMGCKFCGSSFDVLDFEDGVYIGPGLKQKKMEQEAARQAEERQRQAVQSGTGQYQAGQTGAGQNQAGAQINAANPFYQPVPERPAAKSNAERQKEELKENNPFWTPNVKTVTTTQGTKVREYDPDLESPDDMMECNIFTCTTCGAELAVNGVESSTFCAYCGQPTIVFNRVSKTLKPEYIIPFIITKERALEIIRKRLRKGMFIPKEIKNFEVERLRGIYIPYWILDAYYFDDQVWRGTVKSGKSSKTVYFQRSAEVNFTELTMDASRNLNDNSSQKLEPYDLRGKKPFDIGYMQGFYADRYDVGKGEIGKVAMRRTKELFDEEVKKTINASNRMLVQNSPEFKLNNATYAMLPAWFLTFRYDGVAHTLLVNGQTGKIVGGLPFEKMKVLISTIIFSVVSLILTVPLSAAFVGLVRESSDSEGPFRLFAMIVVGVVMLYAAAFANFAKVRKSEALSKEAEMNSYVKDRQEDNGL